jgi:DNA repair protein RadC
MPKEHHHPSQMSFLSPEDAELLHRFRLAFSYFVPLFEAQRAKELEKAPQIRRPEDAYEYVRFEMEGLEQEQMRVLNLNTKNRIISAPMIYQGSLHTTVVRLAEIFRPAIIENANGIVVVHNHPSGESTPSPEDVALTREIVKAGQLLDIEVLDHLVIGRGKPAFVSLKERGLGFTG